MIDDDPSPAAQPVTPAELTVTIVAQHVRRLPGTYTITEAEQPARVDDLATIAVSVAGEHTRVDAAGDRGDWIALYSGGTAHDLDTPGMTVSLLAPLSAARIPLFVASTASADLVLVPVSSVESAAASLRAVGHTVVDD